MCPSVSDGASLYRLCLWDNVVYLDPRSQGTVGFIGECDLQSLMGAGKIYSSCFLSTYKVLSESLCLPVKLQHLFPCVHPFQSDIRTVNL